MALRDLSSQQMINITGAGYLNQTLGAVPLDRQVEVRRSDGCENVDHLQSNWMLLALGHGSQEIARKLFISTRTVDSHRAHIMRKLELETRAELVLFALSNGLIGSA